MWLLGVWGGWGSRVCEEGPGAGVWETSQAALAELLVTGPRWGRHSGPHPRWPASFLPAPEGGAGAAPLLALRTQMFIMFFFTEAAAESHLRLLSTVAQAVKGQGTICWVDCGYVLGTGGTVAGGQGPWGLRQVGRGFPRLTVCEGGVREGRCGRTSVATLPRASGLGRGGFRSPTYSFQLPSSFLLPQCFHFVLCPCHLILLVAEGHLFYRWGLDDQGGKVTSGRPSEEGRWQQEPGLPPAQASSRGAAQRWWDPLADLTVALASG